MRIPKFWARATESLDGHTTEAFGSSDQSPADAQRDASERAKRVLRWLRDPESGDDPHRRYGYGDDRPLREPVVRSLGAEGTAIVTRNAYGALVLNTARVCFIDVDLPEPKRGLAGLLAGLFGGAKGDAAKATLERIVAAVDRERLGVRIYRTRAGFRVLVTSALFDPADRGTDALLERFGSDPRYRALCRVQRCFRARLSPKPWRCGVREPVWPWPFRSREHEEAHASWVRAYERAAQSFAVCELLEARGPRATDPGAASEIAMVEREHDAHCLRPQTTALA
jgi:hypothetical protein